LYFTTYRFATAERRKAQFRCRLKATVPLRRILWPLMIRLRADLEAELGSEVYVAAWERGKGLDVETIIAELLGNA
jgi:hypothetical protein